VSSRRTLILIGAIVLGVIAALLLFNYVRGIEDRANDNARRVDVFVAKQDIARGTPGETPASAITTTDELQRKVALFAIPANATIVQGMFVDPAQTQISFRARLRNPQHVAVSISTDQVRGVGGFLVPGDEVNLMVFSDVQDPSTSPTAAASALPTVGRYLYQKVQVLAVGENTLLAPGETAPEEETTNNGIITFNVPAVAAQWIAAAQENGGIYLSLVGPDYTPEALPAPDPNAPLPGEDPAQITPYGPTGNEE
jgi:Flp pilus assembly protein CpaB